MTELRFDCDVSDAGKLVPRAPATAAQVEILQHSLGIDRDTREPWRNYYCDQDGATALDALVALGLMFHGRTLNKEQRYYHVTEAGRAVAVAALPKPRGRAERRYLRFLSARDAFTDLTFREFLRMDGRG